MLKAVEAIYDNGQIIWSEKPDITTPVKVVITFMEAIEIPKKKKANLSRFINKHQDLPEEVKDQIDKEIEEIRNSWGTRLKKCN